MSWTEIEDYKVSQLFSATDLNLFKGNLNFLAQPPLAYYQHSTTGGDYSTTAVQNMVPIDPVNMALTITTTGGILVAILSVVLFRTGSAIFPAVGYDIDGRYIYRNGSSNPARQAGFNLSTTDDSWTVVMPIFDLAPGEHVVQPLWALDVSGTATIVDDYAPFFGVWEV